MASPAGLGTAGSRLLLAGFLGFAGLVGIASGYEPIYGLAIAFAVAFVVLSLNDLAVGAVVFTALTFMELAPAAGGAVSAAKLAGLVLALTWLAVLFLRDEGRGLFFTDHGLLTSAMLFFIAWTVASWLWAESGSQATEASYRYLLNAALIPILYTAITRRKHARWMVWALIGGATFAAAYGIVASPSVESAATSLTPAASLNRVSGTIGDPNQLAALLVAGTVLAVSQLMDVKRSAGIRWIAAGAALICLLGIAYTLSRGGLVALGISLLAAILFGGKRRIAFAGIAAAILAAVVFYFAALAPPGAADRLTESDGGTGRTDIWKVGWRMFESEPIHGVGAGNFNVSSVHYLFDAGQVARSEFIVDTPLVAHNVYLEVSAEMGLIGLTLFLTLIGGCAGCALRAARRFEGRGEAGMELLARAVLIAIIGLLAADFFISDQYSQQLWILLALGPALLHIAGRSADDEEATERRGPVPTRAAG